MYAAASGNSKLGIPASVANEFINATPPKKKPATHRGGKPRGKPGASHLAALQQAHGSGNFAQSKIHALNYANAVHQFTKPATNGLGALGPSPDAVDPVEVGSTPSSDTIDTSTEQTGMTAQSGNNNRAMLAKLAMSRRGK